MSGNYGQTMGYPGTFTSMQNGSGIPIAHNTYNAQAYFPENHLNNSPNTATTSGNYMRRDHTKLTRPVPQMDLPESKEFRGIYLIIVDCFLNFI